MVAVGMAVAVVVVAVVVVAVAVAVTVAVAVAVAVAAAVAAVAAGAAVAAVAVAAVAVAAVAVAAVGPTVAVQGLRWFQLGSQLWRVAHVAVGVPRPTQLVRRRVQSGSNAMRALPQLSRSLLLLGGLPPTG